MNYSELLKAQKMLELGERASLKEIKDRYRELARQHHPDAGGEEHRSMQEINAAYALLLAYVEDYRFFLCRRGILRTATGRAPAPAVRRRSPMGQQVAGVKLYASSTPFRSSLTISPFIRFR